MELPVSFHTLDLARWNRISIGLGGIVWLLIVLARLFGWIVLDDLELILLLALYAITPLAVPLVSLPEKHRLLCDLADLVIFLQPLATFMVGLRYCSAEDRSPLLPPSCGSCSPCLLRFSV
jgi:hypothetical protein